MRLDSGFHGLDSGFQSLDSGFQSPGFRIPKAKKWWIPDSGFPYKGRSSGIITQLLPGATRREGNIISAPKPIFVCTVQFTSLLYSTTLNFGPLP